MMKNPSSESFLVNLVAGWGAAVIGVCSFWVLHTIWILDVPPVLTEGLLGTVGLGRLELPTSRLSAVNSGPVS